MCCCRRDHGESHEGSRTSRMHCWRSYSRPGGIEEDRSPSKTTQVVPAHHSDHGEGVFHLPILDFARLLLALSPAPAHHALPCHCLLPFFNLIHLHSCLCITAPSLIQSTNRSGPEVDRLLVQVQNPNHTPGTSKSPSTTLLFLLVILPFVTPWKGLSSYPTNSLIKSSS